MKSLFLIPTLCFCLCLCAQSRAQNAAPGLQQNATSITRSEAEHQALKNNPRITASRLLALASGQVTREVQSAELPQISGSMTAVKAEDASRIGAGTLNSSRLYTHAGVGGTLTQLITDFGHTHNLVTNAKLLAKAQEQTALATEQDVLLATDQVFYRLLNAQSLLEVAKAAVAARGNVQDLTQALTKSALKSELDLNVASADYSQAQLLQLDAENAVASASADLAAILNAPANSDFKAVEPSNQTPQPPPENAASVISEAQQQRPDLRALNLDTQAAHKLVTAQKEQRLPTISATAIGGITPVRPDGIFGENWYAAAGVNLSLPLFTGFRISAQTEEARLREKASQQQAQDLSNTIERDVKIAVLATQTAYQRIDVTEKFRTQAAQALGLAKTRYKLGLSSIVELSQAQLQSTQANVAAVNARYDYLLALRTLDYARGNLTP
ncbi:TolC family protein [Acidicapsa ligni]|uniref:TolC family protein n=1 Tax=Acidicapsa ligni TaxID=542300 RepID=UPI0021E0B11A|nr:TolC family protein [Acidicapsa ligni]